jgi:hypothetical protein
LLTITQLAIPTYVHSYLYIGLYIFSAREETWANSFFPTFRCSDATYVFMIRPEKPINFYLPMLLEIQSLRIVLQENFCRKKLSTVLKKSKFGIL